MMRGMYLCQTLDGTTFVIGRADRRTENDEQTTASRQEQDSNDEA